VKHALQNTQNDRQQWLSDSSKLHQISFQPALHPEPRWGAYSAPPDPIAGLKGLTSKTGKGREGRKRRGGEGREREGRGCTNERSHFSEHSDASGFGAVRPPQLDRHCYHVISTAASAISMKLTANIH